ncbi:hypothetical protein Nlim_0349 [Candidatus Nitrosarchaeum limnium SFB1]|jgi:hypothetical protein|uniref:Uncharacterized protein n=1 Tax=Candidatus Nitrosarchaeum limnium SFB1 TaxID=886738 RepID=F3KIQ0_9ARCH|nr:hypothetical protein Nlim_0349 [Candidatus Nitrosarchaeum limnium SFB1]
MSLRDKVINIQNNFDNIPPEQIVEILVQIQSNLKSEITQNYLNGKIQGILGTNDVMEKKKLCKNLKPYLDWYIQGL